MGDIMKFNTYERLLVSKDDKIIEANRNFLEITGYTESELLDKTLIEASQLFRIDSQVNLQEMEDHTAIFLFTKELAAIEGTMSVEFMNNGAERVFSFTTNPINSVSEKFNLATQFAASRGNGIALLSFSGEQSNVLLINSNQSFLNFLEPPYNIKSNSIGKKMADISQAYSDGKLSHIKEHIINTGEPYHIKEIGIDSRNSGENYWDINLVPILGEGVLKYVLVSLSNVTEVVLSRKTIEQRNEQLKVVIENIPDETIIFDQELNITFSNKAARNITCMDQSSSKNMNKIIKNVVIFDKDNQIIPDGNFPCQRVARGECILDYIISTNKASGVIYREVNGFPIYNKSGRLSGGVIIYKDINDRMQAEETRLIKTQKELLTKVIEALDFELIRCTYPELKIISIDGNGWNSFRKINKDIECIDSLIGESYFTIYPICEGTKRKDLSLYLMEKEDYSYIDYTDHIVDGEKRFFKTINQPIYGLNNKVVEIIFITIDITDEVQAKNKAKEALGMQSQMFSMISHELKTPLNVIFSAVQLIEMYLKEAKNQINKKAINNNISTIKQNGYRLIKLINNIIELSSMECGFYKLDLSNRNIIETVESIVESVRSYVETKGLCIIFDTEVEEKIIAIDVEKVESIVLNLISNAVKFSHENETIYVDMKDQGDFIEIHVRDSGIGIDKKNLETIFDKYSKLDDSLAINTEGSGIGLALVQTTVELIGGEISVESEVGKGSVFTVRLPVKLLDESESKTPIEHTDLANRINQINIELSDIV